MGIVILPFFLIGIAAVLAIVDVATMGASSSAMGRGAPAPRGHVPTQRVGDLPPTYGSGNT